MPKNNASATDDRVQACSRAKWRIDSENADYGIPGQEVCASVEKLPGTEYYAWTYFVCCAVTQSQVQGRFKGQDTCLEEAARWLRKFNCPGHPAKQEKTWKQWAMIGQ